MPCTPNDNQINVTPGPPPTVPGFGTVSSPVQIPNPGFDLPSELLEDFNSLISRLSAIFPSGIFKPNPDFSMKTVYDFLSGVLTQIAPFLSLYNFFLALLRIIKCIIDILCAIPNVFAVSQKLVVLFKECLPPFLNLYPAFALAIMIISLLLLILALIEYLISTIFAIIDSILKNLEIFEKASTLNDAQGTLAAINKIASLLCFIQNLMAIFVAFSAITSIIESIAKFAGVVFCDDSDEDGCCPPTLCPPFIKNTPNGITVTNGRLVYLKEISADLASELSPALAAVIKIPPVRQERWQVYAKDLLPEYTIDKIITPTIPVFGTNFWADAAVITNKTPPKRAPYTVDVTLTVNPKLLGFLTDTKGLRKFIIKDCIVIEEPLNGYFDFQNEETSNVNGSLSIAGGLVYEEDGTSYLISGKQATLETFIHQEKSTANSVPVTNDEVFYDVSFVWKPNNPALAGFNITTAGCTPEVSVERAVINSILTTEGIQPWELRLPNVPAGVKVPSVNFLPNISGTQSCIENSLSIFRKNVSAQGAAEFQASVTVCLNDLKNQTSASLCATLLAAISQFKSTFNLDTDLQFTNKNIEVSLTLKDASGTELTNNIPETCAKQIEEKLTTEITFGKISAFKYDGSKLFKANISSDSAGSGNIKVLYDNKVLSVLSTNSDNQTVIEEYSLDYTFVDSTISSPVRRDETDLG